MFKGEINVPSRENSRKMENIDIIHVSVPVSACPAWKSGCDGHSGHVFHWTSSTFILYSARFPLCTSSKHNPRMYFGINP